MTYALLARDTLLISEAAKIIRTESGIASELFKGDLVGNVVRAPLVGVDSELDGISILSTARADEETLPIVPVVLSDIIVVVVVILSVLPAIVVSLIAFPALSLEETLILNLFLFLLLLLLLLVLLAVFITLFTLLILLIHVVPIVGTVIVTYIHES